MNKKSIIYIIIAIIALIAIIGVSAYYFGFFNETTDFDNAFITAIENQTNEMVTTNVTVVLKKDNGKWKIQNDKEVLQAMLGGLNPEVVIS